MASASVLGYPHAGASAALQQPFGSQFPDYYASPALPNPSRANAAPHYDTPISAYGPGQYGSPIIAPGAVAAAQVAGGYGTNKNSTSRSPKLHLKRRSPSRTRTPPPPPASSIASTQQPVSLANAAKDKFKSNLKKVAQQKSNQSPTLDLSMTAEENERRTGISLYGQSGGNQSATDIHFQPISMRRNNTFGYSSEFASYQPTAPFARADSRPHTPRSVNHSHANSTVNSDEPTEASARPSALSSKRPSLRINTSQTAGSFHSITRPRRNTNQSSASATTPGSKPRKSVDKAISIITRRDSSATDDMMDPATRVASIQAARQAFEEHQEKKDAKYEKRAAKDRERQEKRERRKSGTERTRAGSTLPRNGSTLHLTEQADDPVEGTSYEELPIPHPSNRPTMGSRMMTEKSIKYSKKRHAKNRYASFLSWLKTKLLNIGRRRRKA